MWSCPTQYPVPAGAVLTLTGLPCPGHVSRACICTGYNHYQQAKTHAHVPPHWPVAINCGCRLWLPSVAADHDHLWLSHTLASHALHTWPGHYHHAKMYGHIPHSMQYHGQLCCPTHWPPMPWPCEQGMYLKSILLYLYHHHHNHQHL